MLEQKLLAGRRDPTRSHKLYNTSTVPKCTKNRAATLSTNRPAAASTQTNGSILGKLCLELRVPRYHRHATPNIHDPMKLHLPQVRPHQESRLPAKRTRNPPPRR